MKATDLMIGDWVEFIQPDGQGFYAQVEALNDDGTFAECGFFADNMVKPIPLTSDILNKNFPDVRHGIAWCWDDTKSTDNETWYELRTLDIDGIELCINIRYVHELQHVMRLCGIEKEVVL